MIEVAVEIASDEWDAFWMSMRYNPLSNEEDGGYIERYDSVTGKRWLYTADGKVTEITHGL